MALDPDRLRIALEVLAVLLTAVALGYALGPFGLAIAAVIAISWRLTSGLYAFAVGQLLFAIVSTSVVGGLPTEAVLVAQLSLGGVLLVTLISHRPRRTAVVTAITFAVAAAGFATVSTLETLWHGAAILAVAYALTAYTLHRYELVRLGLVTEADQ